MDYDKRSHRDYCTDPVLLKWPTSKVLLSEKYTQLRAENQQAILGLAIGVFGALTLHRERETERCCLWQIAVWASKESVMQRFGPFQASRNAMSREEESCEW